MQQHRHCVIRNNYQATKNTDMYIVHYINYNQYKNIGAKYLPSNADIECFATIEEATSIINHKRKQVNTYLLDNGITDAQIIAYIEATAKKSDFKVENLHLVILDEVARKQTEITNIKNTQRLNIVEAYMLYHLYDLTLVKMPTVYLNQQKININKPTYIKRNIYNVYTLSDLFYSKYLTSFFENKNPIPITLFSNDDVFKTEAFLSNTWAEGVPSSLKRFFVEEDYYDILFNNSLWQHNSFKYSNQFWCALTNAAKYEISTRYNNMKRKLF